MADPVIGKVGASIAQTPLKETGAQPGKQGPSKFDQVQESVAKQQQASQPLPPAVQGVTPAQRKELVSEVRRKMEANPTAEPKAVFGPELGNVGTQLERLRNRVECAPASSGAVQDRLHQIEEQFQQASLSLDKLSTMSDPRSMLQMQIQMYAMTQNIEIVSKAVEQMNSGVKSIMQTQV